MGARYIIGEDTAIDPTDRGLAYGDGLFETMSIHAGSVRRLELHLDRLRLGCDRLRLPMPDRAELIERIGDAVRGIDRGTLKLIFTRGPGQRGYAPPDSPLPTVLLLAEADASVPASGISVATLALRLGENEKLAGIKHLNRLEQVLARLELNEHDADEGLMLSTSGFVVGGTSRNLFAVFGDRIETPAVDRAGIAGVMRRAVIERCETLPIELTETELEIADLLRADELFMTNALVGIQSVNRLDATQFRSTAVAARLRRALESGNAEPGH